MASFSCGICLAAAQLVIVTGDLGDRHATSGCLHCGAVNRVALDDAQTEQLWTAPRGSTYVHFAPEYW